MDQIHYYSWNAVLAPGHENYWIDMAFIAKTLALFLEGINPKVKRKDDIAKYRTTTIAIIDYKEKFGEPKVYCKLASLEMIQELHLAASDDMSLAGFSEICLAVDMSHYRQTYFLIKKIWPQYWDAIYAGADHKEYLQDSREEFLKNYDSLDQKEKERILKVIYRVQENKKSP